MTDKKVLKYIKSGKGLPPIGNNYYICPISGECVNANHIKETRLNRIMKEYPNVYIEDDGFPLVLPCELDKTRKEKCSYDCADCINGYWNEVVE